MDISVIMPSYLEHYPGCAANRQDLFIRAVNSFLLNEFKSKELIIISDGCEKTRELYRHLLAPHDDIMLVSIEKQELFSGAVRQAGLNVASGRIIAYLDTDDTLGKHHLKTIVENFGSSDWVYYNDLIITPDGTALKVANPLKRDSIGTSSIAHLHKLPVTWQGCNGYGHDYTFIEQLIKASTNYKKIYGCEYNIHHIPGIIG